MLPSAKIKLLKDLDRKVLHNIRNEGMKVFGQYFMFYVTEGGVDADEANALALRQTSTILAEICDEFQQKAEYKSK